MTARLRPLAILVGVNAGIVAAWNLVFGDFILGTWAAWACFFAFARASAERACLAKLDRTT